MILPVEATTANRLQTGSAKYLIYHTSQPAQMLEQRGMDVERRLNVKITL